MLREDVPPQIAALAEAPGETALLLDVDGTLAPIVPVPADAAVPDETRGELRRLAARYALVACVSGRPGDDARRVVGVPELVYVGEHGLELAPDAAKWSGLLRDFALATGWDDLELKPLSASLHYRRAPDEAAALEELHPIEADARRIGLVPKRGRKVLELRPPVDADKGTAVRALLSERGLRRALYAGDDTTDLDGFRALDGLDLPVRLAVVTAESPPGLREAADLVVDGPAALLVLLRAL